MDTETYQKGLVALDEMYMKAQDWYEWTIKNEIEIHPYNDYVPVEYLDKIHEWMLPYIMRLYQTGYITLDDLSKFEKYIRDLAFDLRVKSEFATWTFHWNQMNFRARLKWRWQNKRIRKYELRDIERLCRKNEFVPLL